MSKVLKFALAAVAATGVLFPAEADSERFRFRGGAASAPASGSFRLAQLMPLEQVLANVARQVPGRPLDVDGPFQRGGRWIYRIKWFNAAEGRVLIVLADAETGRILDIRR